jgi:signal peptidase I
MIEHGREAFNRKLVRARQGRPHWNGLWGFALISLPRWAVIPALMARRTDRNPSSPASNASDKAPESASAKAPKKGFLREVREIWDTLVLAFTLVTLMKTFVVDLYKIPTGSMTPTLIGDVIAWDDWNEDGRQDLFILEPSLAQFGLIPARQVFVRQADGTLRCSSDAQRSVAGVNRRFSASQVEARFDRILVNKMWYWFHPLGRGDIVVFKLPTTPHPERPDQSLFDPLTPFYIKRVAALEGEVPDITDAGDLVIDGEIVTEPPVFTRNHYFNSSIDSRSGMPAFDRRTGRAVNRLEYLGSTVPDDSFYVFGDNSGNSWDSRYWGGIPVDRIRGRAFFRYWPLKHVSFLQ